MKSIEELLEIIKGVDMDLWDNVEQEAYDEILSRFAEQKGIINSLCVRWGHSIRLLSIIEERFKQRCELSINCNNCYAGLLTKINKKSLVENDLTDLSLYSEREKLICDQKKKIAELEKENERLILKNNWYHEEHAKEMNKRVELEKYRMFFESCSCLFAEGVEFMTKTEIYEAIKKEVKKLEQSDNLTREERR